MVDLYEYDSLMQLSWQYKYLGPMEKSERLQSAFFTYDAMGRTTQREAFDVSSGKLYSTQQYSYDALGRIDTVKNGDFGGDSRAWYGYAPHGPFKWVSLGDETGAKSIVNYGYHIRGWTKDIAVERTDSVLQTYRQVLGYEAKTINQASVPNLSEPSYTGQITQQLYKFTSDVPTPVRAVNYSYDMQGRMTTADYHQGTGLNASQRLQFPLSLVDTNVLATRVEYDVNGRILGKRSGGVSSYDSARYQYDGDSYRLESVQGKLEATGNRDASRFYNFQYDAAGRMTRDESKWLNIAYGYDAMPVEMAVRKDAAETVLYPLYDATGYRVSQVAATRLAHEYPVYIVGNVESDSDQGLYNAATIGSALADANYWLNFRNYPPDTLRLYVVPNAGVDTVVPDVIVEPLYKGDTLVPVVVYGVLKYSAKYDSLVARHKGRKQFASHTINLDGWRVGEVREAYGAAGEVNWRRSDGTLYGRGGSVIGRRVQRGTFWEVQYYVKNHLGSTVRVVNADGSYAATPVFDYQPYGELQSIREDSLNPVSEKFTGKSLDTEVNLYYFGARWYDQELGTWISPDPAHDGFNPYGYVGGNPIFFYDPFGLWKLGFGVVVGWNRRDGWSIGFGVAADDINLGVAELNTDFSHSFNQNGSQTTTLQAGASGCLALCVGGTAGGSYNTQAGYSATLSGNVGVGITNHLQVGVEAGTNHYWTTGGNYIGGDLYGGAYAQMVARVSAGYSHGFGAIESGFYARASLLGTSAGYHSAQGWNTGFTHRVGVANYDSKGGWSVDNDAKILAGLFAVNTEAGVMGAAGQLASRFTWELAQTALGVGANYLMNELGLVSGVSYHKGRVYAEGTALNPFTLGNYIGGQFAGHREHEFGHTIQSQVYGPGYLGIMIASPISAATSSYAAHMGRWYETQATAWGNKAY